LRTLAKPAGNDLDAYVHRSVSDCSRVGRWWHFGKVAFEKIVEERSNDGNCGKLPDVCPRRRERRADNIGSEFEFKREQQPCAELPPGVTADFYALRPPEHPWHAENEHLDRTDGNQHSRRKLDGESDAVCQRSKKRFHELRQGSRRVAHDTTADMASAITGPSPLSTRK
jgi:hypothetical protein